LRDLIANARPSGGAVDVVATTVDDVGVIIAEHHLKFGAADLNTK
jgi:hypothetical protein